MFRVGVSKITPHHAPDVVIVTTAAKLAGLIDDAVERAVRRALLEVRDERREPAAWLTVRDAERAYGRSRSTLARWRERGLIASRKLGGTRYYGAPSASPDSHSENARAPPEPRPRLAPFHTKKFTTG